MSRATTDGQFLSLITLHMATEKEKAKAAADHDGDNAVGVITCASFSPLPREYQGALAPPPSTHAPTYHGHSLLLKSLLQFLFPLGFFGRLQQTVNHSMIPVTS